MDGLKYVLTPLPLSRSTRLSPSLLNTDSGCRYSVTLKPVDRTMTSAGTSTPFSVVTVRPWAETIVSGRRRLNLGLCSEGQ